MAQIRNWITLDSIIWDYINQAELSKHKYFKLFHIAFRAMEQLGLNFFYEIKSVKLPVTSSKTIIIPDDYLYYNKVGVFNSLGELVPLKYNDKLSVYHDTTTTRVADIAADTISSIYSYTSPTFFNYWDGDTYGNLYGVAVNDIYGGGFKDDVRSGVILLDPSFGWDSVVLEYTASPQEGQDYYIPMQFREAIIAWLRWQNNVESPKLNGNKANIFRHDYFEAMRLAIRDFRPFYLDQAYMQGVDNQRLVVKV